MEDQMKLYWVFTERQMKFINIRPIDSRRLDGLYTILSDEIQKARPSDLTGLWH